MDEAGGVSSAEDRCAKPDQSPGGTAALKKPRSWLRPAVAVGVCVGVVLTAMAAVSGFRAHDAHRAERQQELFLRVGRQSALNLSTISHVAADADIQRIVDSSIGTFHDEFQQRSKPFVAYVKSEQAQSVGTVTEAGLESVTGDSARVLVAVSVDTTTAAVPAPHHNSFRMRIDLKMVGQDVRISDVEFIS
jgi:Mce-associated membrane protein